MAWRSSGADNTEMVNKLKSFGVISSEHAENGFRSVDRKLFVPRGNESLAWSDQPLKEGNVHISAPHIYGSAVEALELVPNSSLSFLNIGSGTGYVSCVAAHILGRNSLNYGVELHDDVINHAILSISKWRSNTVEKKDDVTTLRFADGTPDIQLIKGNGLNILEDKGESIAGFDRIYIGAAVEKDDLARLTKLLSPGGILVGPVDDELVKVMRVGNISLEVEEEHDCSISGLSEEYTSQILSGVRFAPLVMHPPLPTVIPCTEWNPSVYQQGYPSEYKQASVQLLMCSGSQITQPPPPVPSEEDRFNAAALLPRSLWLEILSYTHRRWFQPELNETDYLKRRLREEKAKVANAERQRREAEDKCRAAERERAVYRLLARRWQTRLAAALSRRDDARAASAQDRAAEELAALLDAAAESDRGSSLAGVEVLLRQMGGESEEEDEEDSGSDASDADMDDEGSMDEHDGPDEEDLLDLFEGDGASEADEFASLVDDDDASMVMDDAEESDPSAHLRFPDQPRSISMSSDDL